VKINDVGSSKLGIVRFCIVVAKDSVEESIFMNRIKVNDCLENLQM